MAFDGTVMVTGGAGYIGSHAVLALLGAAGGVKLARMSGSGATCFAIFGDAEARDAAAGAAREQGWWVLSTFLR